MILDPVLNMFRGKAITIPPMDGAFRPNTALDDAEPLVTLTAPDALAWHQGRLIASSGPDLVAVGQGTIATHPAPITALAAAPDGALAVALDDGTLILDGQTLTTPDTLRCVTALAFAPDGALWLANGSTRHPASAWVADLMEKNATGAVWRYHDGSFAQIAGGLAFPYGLLPDAKGVTVSESWRHQLIRLEAGRQTAAVRHLPGYPARLTRAPDGGAWLTLFAPRNRLIEFVLQETHFRYDMMAEVPRAHWIAPALASGRSFLEPLQCGGIKTLGIHKAWSPSRSYGLVVRLGPDLTPLSSLHSRANGHRHGTTCALQVDNRLYVAAKGGDCVLALEGV
ncbi:MAG: hypothetical protein H7245_09970 [Candidatus Saccharibacteria bacterium]|nr:hypothetical protein [Pseudorhodobacter sp.]